MLALAPFQIPDKWFEMLLHGHCAQDCSAQRAAQECVRPTTKHGQNSGSIGDRRANTMMAYSA